MTITLDEALVRIRRSARTLNTRGMGRQSEELLEASGIEPKEPVQSDKGMGRMKNDAN